MGKPRPKLLKVFVNELKLRNYSPKTIKAYRSCIRSFVTHFEPRHPRDLSDEDVRSYLLYLLETKKRPAGTVNQVYNALKFLFEELYHLPFVIKNLPRPQKDRKLPDVLNTSEVRKVFAAVRSTPKESVP